MRRIQSSFGDVERRQVEQLQRIVERAAERYAEAAGQQFEATVRSAREEAAQRLARELDRAVQAFAREAERARRASSAESRRRGRAADSRSGCARSPPASSASGRGVAALEQRLGQAEPSSGHACSSSPRTPSAERAVLEGRLQELARRIDEAAASAEARLRATAAYGANKLRAEGFVSPRTNEHASDEPGHRPQHTRARQGRELAPARADGGRLPAPARRAHRGERGRPAPAVELVGRGCTPETAAEILL